MAEQNNVKYFYNLLGHKSQSEIRIFGDKYKNGKSVFVNDFKTFLETIKKFQNEKQSVYVGIHERKLNRKGNKNVLGGQVLPIDVDSKDFENQEKYEEYLKKLENKIEQFDLKFSCKIMSGHGTHYYLRIPRQNAGFLDEILKNFKSFLLNEVGVGFDKSIYNLERVMRVPETYNFKDKDNPIESKIIETNEVSEENISRNLKVIRNYQPKKPSKKQKVSEKNEKKSDGSKDKIKEKIRNFLDLIVSDKYDVWFLVGAALKNIGYNEGIEDDEMFNLFDEWSSKSEKYDGTESCEEKWQEFSIDSKNPGWGTLVFFAKDSVGIQLPGVGRTNREFSEDLAKIFDRDEEIFFNENEQKIVEIKQMFDKYSQKNVLSFKKLDVVDVFNKVEKKLSKLGLNTFFMQGDNIKIKSPKKLDIELFAGSDSFIDKLNKVNRFFTYPYLYLTDDGLKTTKSGYNEDLSAYTVTGLEIEDMTTGEAKRWMHYILKDFCFESDEDYYMALAYLMTPAARGIYSNPTKRSPFFVFLGNREGVGKDFLAGCSGIIYEGQDVQNSPISTDSKYENKDEFRKQLLSIFRGGRRRFHSSNNRGMLNNEILEMILTNETFEDRLLGSSTQLTFPNELDISASGNIGLRYTPDLARRTRTIKLFYADEDIKKRNFSDPNLHGTIKKNRGKFLSALYQLFSDWYKNAPDYNLEFSGFHEWANVVGGAIKYHYGFDVTNEQQQDELSGDSETADMKKFFEFMYKFTGNGERSFTIKEIFEKLKGTPDSFRNKDLLQENEEIDFFEDILKDSNGKKILGKKIRKFVGRIFNNKKILKTKDGSNSTRHEFTIMEVKSK